MRLGKKLAIGILVLSASFTMFAEDGVTRDFSKPQTFTGTVVPIITQTVKYGFNDSYRGIITYTARPGQVLHGPVYNAKGEVVTPGTLMIEMDTAYRKALVDASAAKVALDKEDLAFKQTQYDRYAKLSNQKAISLEEAQTWENNYKMAKSQLAADIAQYELNQTVYKMCWLRSQYDAIVDQVFFPYGLPAGELDVMKVSQLNPIGIEVKMDRDTATYLNQSTSVEIYPIDVDQPVMNIKGVTTYTDDGVIMRVINYQRPPKVSAKTGKNIPIVECAPVVRLYSSYVNPVVYGIPVLSICHDEKGDYVWKGVDAQQIPGKAFKSVFEVTKVYVELGDHVVRIDGSKPCREVKITKDIQPGDTIVINPPKDLQEGSEVDFSEIRYLFMPDDQVKVVFQNKQEI